METLKIKKESIIFKINCDTESGLGHLIRCVRIANNLKKKYKIFFFIDYLKKNNELENFLKNFNVFSIYKNNQVFINQNDDYLKFKKLTKKIKANTIIIDDYRLSAIWHKKLRKDYKKIIIIDDLANRRFFGDYYINYKNTNIKLLKSRLVKKCNKEMKFLLGSKYCILDKNLISQKSKKFGIMINFGNAFDFKKLFKLVYFFEKDIFFKNFNIYICIGYFSKNFKYILKLKNKNFKIIFKKIFIENYLKKINLFIGSSGQSIYDMSYLNIPSIFFITKKNQSNLSRDMMSLGHYFVFNNKEYNKIKIFKLIKNLILNYKITKQINYKKKIKLKKNGSVLILKSLKLI